MPCVMMDAVRAVWVTSPQEKRNDTEAAKKMPWYRERDTKGKQKSPGIEKAAGTVTVVIRAVRATSLSKRIKTV